jgi:predicted nucleotide-binding protein
LWERQTTITVAAPERKKIEAIFEVFEMNAGNCKLPSLPEKPKPILPKPIPSVFIGHGRSEQWRDLKDHLHEQHGYEVEAYETGARAGHEIRDILAEMLGKVSFAVLVMTGEDEAEGGKMRARQNVVHELGLFQGHLGFSQRLLCYWRKILRNFRTFQVFIKSGMQKGTSRKPSEMCLLP